MWTIDIKNQNNGLYVFAFYKNHLALTANFNNNGRVSFVRRDKLRKYNKYKVVFTDKYLIGRIIDHNTDHKWNLSHVTLPQKSNNNIGELILSCDGHNSYYITFTPASYRIDYFGVLNLIEYKDGSRVFDRGFKRLRWNRARKEGDGRRRNPRFPDEYEIVTRS